MAEGPNPYESDEYERVTAIEEAKRLLFMNGYSVIPPRTLEDIHPADREYSSMYRDRYGERVTANGIAWEERMCDEDYVNTVRFGSNRYGDGGGDWFDRDEGRPIREDMPMQCRSCGRVWEDSRLNVPCPQCGSTEEHILLDAEPPEPTAYEDGSDRPMRWELADDER